MVPLEERLRNKLLTRRRELFRAVAQIEGDLRWLETDVESELVERGQDETFIRLLARLEALPATATCLACAKARESQAI